MKEKFIYYLKDNYYRIKIIKENPKFKYDERISCTLEESIAIRNKILFDNDINLVRILKHDDFIEVKKVTKSKSKIMKNDYKPVKVDKYIYLQKNGKYRVFIRRANKATKSHAYYSETGIATIKEAKEIRDIKLAEIFLYKGKRKINTITFGEFVKYWFENYCKKELSPTTLRSIITSMNNYILPTFCEMKLADIKTKDLQLFFSELKQRKKQKPDKDGKYQNLSTNTLSGIYRLLRNVLNRAVDWEYLEINLMSKVKNIPIKVKEKNIYSKKELLEIIELLKNENLFTQTIFTTLICSGMRRSELLGLCPNDIDFDLKIIFIKRSAVYDSEKKEVINKNTKTESSKRTIPMPIFCIELLKKYIDTRSINGKYENIFVSSNGKIINPNTITHLWQSIRRKYNLKDINVHGLRHSYCSLQVNDNDRLSIADVSKLMGHSQISTTLKYIHTNTVEISCITAVFTLE